METVIPVVKIVVVGDGGVGKTTLVYKLIGTDRVIKMTPGISIESMQFKFSDDNIADVVFWDLGGQPQFRFFQKDFFECANILLLVFDLNRYLSFKKLETEWIPLIKDTEIGDTAVQILVGNKLDLGQTIQEEEIQEFATKYNMRYFKISAKEGTNISDLLKYIKYLIDNCFD